MFRHTKQLQFPSKPDKPDALYAMKLQEVLGGQYGEMTVAMQYLFQGWSCRVAGKYKDMIMDIATEEIGHVEMIATMVARLLEGAPSEVTSAAVAANPALAAVVGGQNPQQAIVAGGGPMPTNSQGVPWSGSYIVASGNLLCDFRSNAAAEGQSRLQTARLYNMTDDAGVKAMLKFNLARDTMHQNQWLAAIYELKDDGLINSIVEDDLSDQEDQEQHFTFWNLSEGNESQQGRWASGEMPDGRGNFRYLADPQPLGDPQTVPAPDPLLFATYDGHAGEGKPGNAAGAMAQGAENVVEKVKDVFK